MITKEDIIARHEEVRKLFDWWVYRSPRRNEFIQEHYASADECFSDVYLRMLVTLNANPSQHGTLSCVVTRAITWQLAEVAGKSDRTPQDLLDYPDRRLDVLDDLAYSEHEDRVQFESLLDLLHRLRKCVHARTYRILWLYAGLDGVSHTLASIGKLEGVTRERVRQLMERAAEKLEPQNKVEAKIRETAWRERLGKSAAGRILLEEFDTHCPLPASV